MTEKETLSWQALLARILKDRRERERIAQEVGVSTRTLGRWTDPANKLPEIKRQLLLQALPKTYRATIEDLMLKERSQVSVAEMQNALPQEYHAAFLDLVKRAQGADKELVPPVKEELSVIPAVFYKVAVDAACRMDLSLLTKSLMYMGFVQIAGILDRAAGKPGTLLLAFKCHLGEDDLVHTQSELQAFGTGPFHRVAVRTEGAFVGAEALAGQAVASRRPLSVLRDDWLSALGMEEGGSMHAFPILRRNQVAGALVLYRVAESDSLEKERKLLSEYSQLLAALAFTEKDFYAPAQIRLIPLIPSLDFQERFLLFSGQQLALLAQSAKASGAEKTAQELEDELLALLLHRLADE